jgi:ABC-2 type transport system permease protein
VGRTLGGATVACIQGLLVLLISLVAGFRPQDLGTLPLAFLFMFLISLFFTALGTAVASVLEDMQGFQLIMNFLVMPIFFLSGALFPLAGLQGVMAVLTRVNPLSYGVDGLRGALLGSCQFGMGQDLLVLSVLTLLFLALGAKLFSKIQI